MEAVEAVEKSGCKVPGSFRGRDWAEEFNKVLVKTGDQPCDAGFLEGWFANAIMRGYDEADKTWRDAIDKVNIEKVLDGFSYKGVAGHNKLIWSDKTRIEIADAIRKMLRRM